MTETLGSAGSRAASGAAGAAGAGPLAGMAQSEAVDRLKEEARAYLAARAERVLIGAGRKLGEATGKLNDVAEGNSPGFARLALDTGRKFAEGKGPLRSALEIGASRAKDSVKGAFKNLGGGKKERKGSAGHKPTVIMESVDVGVPLRTAYDQWTRYQDFSGFAKGVKSAGRDDDTTSDWKLKVFWSNRSWKGHIQEQVPDDRVSWTSEGGKGTTKGVVSFHPLADSLTRVLLVMEYYPQGFFEKTGNIWRAQGRRARLDLKNFARFITIKGEAEEGWRGEIRDGEVVRTHEEAVEGEVEGERAYDEGDAEYGADDEGAYDQDSEDVDGENGGYAEDVEDAEDENGAYDEDAERVEDEEDAHQAREPAAGGSRR